MLNYLKLGNVGPSPSMEIEFRPRMNFLTGDNGLGKTFLLDIAWWVLTRTWAKLPAAPPLRAWKTPRGIARGTASIAFGYEQASGGPLEFESIFNRGDQQWAVKRGRSAVAGAVIYAQADGGFCVWDPARNYWKDKEPEKPGRPAAFRFKPDEVWDGLPRDTPEKLCNGLILDWASWQRENGDAYSQLTRVLRALSPSPTEPLRPGKLARIDLADARDQPTLLLAYGQEVPLAVASAGMRRIVALAYLLVWTWQEHLRASEIRGTKPIKEIIFLIDEIEAHLHPQWQRRIVKALVDVMSALTERQDVSVQLIATTHSPLVLASIEPDFDDAKDAIWELDLIKDRVELRQFPWRRVGDVNNWLTSTAFDLSEPRGVEAEETLEEAKARLRRPSKPTLAEFEKVDQKLRGVLGDVDPFWIRWSYHLDRMRGEP